MNIKLIAALTDDRVIGNDGSIPWNIPGEQKHFRKETLESPVIMGRKTFENIVEKNGEPLEERLNIVLTNSENYPYENTVVARNKQAALEAAMDSVEDQVFVAGGETVYEQFIDEADEMVLTWIKQEHQGDSYFPDFTISDWKTRAQAISDNYSIVNYERR